MESRKIFLSLAMCLVVTLVLTGAAHADFTADSRGRGPEGFQRFMGYEEAIVQPPLPPGACAGGVVSGTVKSEGGTGIAGAEILAWEEFSQTRTTTTADAAGAYSLCLTPGNYGISFYARGYLQKVYNNKEYGCGDAVTVTAGGVTGVNAVLPRGGSIAGRVTDGKDPIEGIRVVAQGMGIVTGYSTLTDADGAYLVESLPTADYSVRFFGGAGEEYYNDRATEAEADPVPVTAPLTTAGIDAVMPPGGTISGTVTDGTAGIGIISVQVLHPDGTGAAGASTLSDGTYTVQGLRTGTYRVYFHGQTAGYVSEWFGDSRNEENALTVTVTAPANTPGIDAVLAAGGSISGNVTVDGNPADGSWVRVIDASGDEVAQWGRQVRTDIDGNYIFKGLATGEYRVFFPGPGNGNTDEWYDGRSGLPEADKVSVIAPADTANIDAHLSAKEPGTISGRVSFPKGSCGGFIVWTFAADPVEDSGRWEHDFAWIGPTGAWSSRGLPAGPYRVLAAPADWWDNLQNRWHGDTPAPGLARIVQVRNNRDTGGIDFSIAPEKRYPVPDLMVGDAASITFMGPGEKEPVSFSMDCNAAHGYPLDWGLIALTPLPAPRNIYHFVPHQGWIPGLGVTWQGPCFDTSEFKLMELPYLPLGGDVDLFLGVDGDMNGSLDLKQFFYDGVRVHMYR